jgi:hypothetical protein
MAENQTEKLLIITQRASLHSAKSLVCPGRWLIIAGKTRDRTIAMQAFLVRLLTSLAVATLIAACGTIERDKKNNALEAALNRYGEALRWGYYDTARGFLHPDKREAVPGELENIQVTAYQVVQAPLQSDDQTAAQVVRIDYLHEDVQRIHTLTDRQQWRYEPATKTWWLYSGLPGFE